jgi:hypothetical protein
MYINSQLFIYMKCIISFLVFSVSLSIKRFFREVPPVGKRAVFARYHRSRREPLFVYLPWGDAKRTRSHHYQAFQCRLFQILIHTVAWMNVDQGEQVIGYNLLSGIVVG